MSAYLTPEEREGLKKEIFSSLHCALPGIVESYDPEKQTVSVRIPEGKGSTPFPLLTDVPVFMPVPFEVNPGEMALVVFSDLETESLLAPAEEAPVSLRRHSLSDGFAFVGWKFVSGGEEVP